LERVGSNPGLFSISGQLPGTRDIFATPSERLAMSSFSFRACLLAGLLAITPALAMAKSYTIPNPNPVAVITVPDDWETEETTRGLESTSEDEGVYFTVEVTDFDSVEKDMTRAIAALVAEGVVLDIATQKQTEFSVNGLKAFMTFWNAKDEDGSTQISITLVLVSDKKALMMTGWGTEEAQKENLEELTAIMNSIKMVQ
jgi:hypothetical protein